MFNQARFDEAVKAVKYERTYQESKWGDLDDDWSVADWCDLVEIYARKASDAILGADSVEDANEKRMNLIRQTAALCVAAMEKQGVIRR